MFANNYIMQYSIFRVGAFEAHMGFSEELNDGSDDKPEKYFRSILVVVLCFD